MHPRRCGGEGNGMTRPGQRLKPLLKGLAEGTGRNPLRSQAGGYTRDLRLADGRPVQRQKIFSDFHHDPFSQDLFNCTSVVGIIMPQDPESGHLFFQSLQFFTVLRGTVDSIRFPDQTEKGIGGQEISFPLRGRKLFAAVPHLPDVVDDRGSLPGVEIDPVKRHAVLVQHGVSGNMLHESPAKADRPTCRAPGIGQPAG